MLVDCLTTLLRVSSRVLNLSLARPTEPGIVGSSLAKITRVWFCCPGSHVFGPAAPFYAFYANCLWPGVRCTNEQTIIPHEHRHLAMLG